jgi:hypothetical protein
VLKYLLVFGVLAVFAYLLLGAPISGAIHGVVDGIGRNFNP